MTAVKVQKKPQSPEEKIRALAQKRANVGLPVDGEQLRKLLRSTGRKGDEVRQ